MPKNFRVIIPQNVQPTPEKFEISAAMLLAIFFQTDVEFIPKGSISTPDIMIYNIRWEIKSPLGNGKRNIQHQFSRAMKQSKNIVIDARRSKMDIRKIRKELRKQVGLHKSIQRLILITKEEKIEVIK
jgi:hypothetical protein